MALKESHREPFGKLVATALILVSSVWISLYLFGYGLGTALLLAWLSSGLLVPAVVALSFIWPKLMNTLASRTGLLGNDTASRQPVRFDRQ